MIIVLIEFAIVLAGFAVTAILFHRIPALPDPIEDVTNYPTISIIIPARNEERNLPLLLEDLSKQTHPVLEIICVDDESEDATAQIALAHGAKLISLSNKPTGWIGKSWACQNGANIAKGDLLLFLDADVRLAPNGIHTLLSVYLLEN